MGGISSAGLPVSGGTVTGPVTLTSGASPGTLTISGSTAGPPNATLYAKVGQVTGTFTGTAQTGVFNHVINNFAVNNSSTGHIRNTVVSTVFGGANQVGGFINLDSSLLVHAASNNPSGATYQATNAQGWADANDGGVLNANLGALFGQGSYAKLLSGATFWRSAIVQENDLSIATGASAWYAGGVSVVLLSDNAVAADRENFGFLVGAQLGATPTIDVGIAFGGYQGYNPLAATAALMEWRDNGGGLGNGPTITRGISLTGFTFTGNAFASTNYSVDGSGNIICKTAKTTPVAVASLPSASSVGAGTRAFVTDATASTFASTVTGGGSTNVPVYSDGTNWKIG